MLKGTLRSLLRTRVKRRRAPQNNIIPMMHVDILSLILSCVASYQVQHGGYFATAASYLSLCMEEPEPAEQRKSEGGEAAQSAE